MRCASQSGTRPPCNGRSATPERFMGEIIADSCNGCRGEKAEGLFWQTNSKFRSTVRSVHYSQGAAVLGNNSMRQRKADAVARRFGGEEGNEDLLPVGRGNSGASVANCDPCRTGR